MDQPYVIAYYAPLFTLGFLSLVFNDKDFIRITFISALAFGVTRMITLVPESGRYMFDFSNDVVVCLAFLWLVRSNKFVPFLIGTYTLMWLGSYIPFALGVLTHTEHRYVLEAISVLQLLLIFGGIAHGTGPRKLLWNIFNFMHRAFILVRNQNVQKTHERVEGTGDNIGNLGGDSRPLQENSKEVKIPTYGLTALDYWKPVK